MKKLIELIKAKEKENSPSPKENKANTKVKSTQLPFTPEDGQQSTNDLFWDGYSDIGYC